MTELAIRTASIPDKLTYARGLAASGMLPKQYHGHPENILWAIEYGETVGITPMAAITGVHVIDGKPSASAALIGGLVRRAGHKLRVTGDNRSATAQIIRSDDPDYTFSVTFTMDDARIAGLTNKGVWKSYPAAMLRARAITQVARDACEEILFGLHYTPEELGAEVDGEGELLERRAERQAPTALPVDQWSTPAAPAEQHSTSTSDDVENAEVIDEDAEQAPADLPPTGPLMASKGQQANLAMRFGEKGITDRTARLDHTSALLERCVTSFTELTFAEYQTVAKALHGGWPHIQPGPATMSEPPAELEDNPVRDILASGIADANSPDTLKQAGKDVADELQRGTITPAEANWLKDAWKARQDALRAEHAAVAA